MLSMAILFSMLANHQIRRQATCKWVVSLVIADDTVYIFLKKFVWVCMG